MKFRFAITAVVSISLAGILAAKKKSDESSAAMQQRRALHALSRLTFGPRPGEVNAVTAMGVERWIEEQLHPEKIENTALEARLEAYRTLKMSSRELALEFPPPQLLKAVQDGKLAIPHDPYQRAVYAANLTRVAEKKESKQEASGTVPVSAVMKPAAPGLTNSANAGPIGASEGQNSHDRRQRNLLVDQLTTLDPATRMQRILALTPEEQSELTRGLPEPKLQALLAGLSPAQSETVQAMGNPTGVVNGELQSAKLLRAVYSDRQLEEVLTDFWFNHFNVYIGKGADRYLVTAYERDVIRPHVLGKFKELLIATAQSPAMLFYLDNWESEGPHSDAALGINSQVAQNRPRNQGRWANEPFGAHPVGHPPRPRTAPNAQVIQQKRRNGLNENYARELMELHTLGVNGGYTQKDVTEVAKVFTGWTIADLREGGGFVFKPRLHEPGAKTVLGHTIKDNGEKEGLEVLNLLAHSPATARFISTQLAIRFVSDNPPQPLVDAMSKTFLKTDGDVREVLRTMFRAPEFWSADAYDAKVKTPLEFVTSALRATEADVSDPRPLLNSLNQMGMPLYGMQPPTGYSTKADLWVNSSALLARMNFALALVNNKLYGTSFDLAKLSASPVGLSSEIDLYQEQVKLERVLLEGQVSAQTHSTIEDKIVAPQGPTADGAARQGPKLNAIAALLLGSPEFQRR